MSMAKSLSKCSVYMLDRILELPIIYLKNENITCKLYVDSPCKFTITFRISLVNLISHIQVHITLWQSL